MIKNKEYQGNAIIIEMSYLEREKTYKQNWDELCQEKENVGSKKCFAMENVFFMINDLNQYFMNLFFDTINFCCCEKL